MPSWHFFRKFLSFQYNFSHHDDTEETDKCSGRVLPKKEYLKKISRRNDIFIFKSAKLLYAIMLVCVIITIIVGIWLSNSKQIEIATDFYEQMPVEQGAALIKSLPEVKKSSDTFSSHNKL